MIRPSRLLKQGLVECWRDRASNIAILVLFTLANLGIFVPLAVRDSEDRFVKLKAREILTADFQVSSHRPLLSEELELLNSRLQPQALAQEVELLATIQGPEESALVELKGVEDAYPLYGRVLLTNGEVGNFAQLKSNEIWLAEELAWSQHLAIGNEVKIGEQKFTIARFIRADVALTRGAVGFAPRAYVRRETIEATGLLQKGAQINYRALYRLVSQFEFENSKSRLGEWSEDVVFRWPEDAVQGIRRVLDSVAQYLGLLTLFFSLLCLLAGYYLLRQHFRLRGKWFALCQIFGATKRQLKLTLSFLIAGYVCSGYLMAFTIERIFIHLVNNINLLESFGGLQVSVSARSEIVVLGFSMLVAALSFVGILSSLKRQDLNELFHDAEPNLPQMRSRAEALQYILLASLFFAVGTLSVGSWSIGGALSAVVLGLTVIAVAVLPRIARAALPLIRKSPRLRLAILRGRFPQFEVSLSWMSLAWCLLLLATLPNLILTIEDELRAPKTREIPQFFAVNISSRDLDPLKSRIRQLGGELRHISPLLLGRLMKINGREVTEGQLARFPLRLTFRPQMSDSEQIVTGREFAKLSRTSDFTGISIEKDFADRNNFKLGDQLEFEVAGLSVKTEIQNLRKVQWSTFQPNFFIQFPTGTLDDFPKSYIAVVFGFPAQKLLKFQTQVAREFPNLSLIHVATTIERLKEIVNRFILPLRTTTLTLIFLVFLLAMAIMVNSRRLRFKEELLLSALGLGGRQVMTIGLIETLIWMGLALPFGYSIGNGISLIVTKKFFSRPPIWGYKDQVIYGLFFLLAISFAVIVHSLKKKRAKL